MKSSCNARSRGVGEFSSIKKSQIKLLLTLKVSPKMHLEMSSTKVICCIYVLTLLNTLSKVANSVDLDQTATGESDLDVHCLLEDSKTFQQTTKQTSIEVMGTLRLTTCFLGMFA